VNGVAAPDGRVQEAAEWAGNEYFKQKQKKNYLHSTNFILLSHIMGNSINKCNVFF
jgi:hypothetical protein